MQQGSGNGGFGGLFQRGQVETRKHNKETEHDLPLRQTGSNIVLYTAAFLLILANIVIIGPSVGFTFGFVVIVWGIKILNGFFARTRAHRFIPAAAITAILCWLWVGPRFVALVWYDGRCEWRPIYKLTFFVFSCGILFILGFNIFRFLYEVVDPNSPGPVGIRPPEWGVMWPWFVVPSDEPEIVEVEVETVRDIPRPVPTNGLPVEPELPPDPQRVLSATNTTIRAPSRREVLVSDLVTFIRLASELTPAFSAWDKRRRSDGTEWDKDTWDDVVDVWGLYGVTTKREPRKKTRLLVTDFTEAMGRLSSAFDPPAPPEAE